MEYGISVTEFDDHTIVHLFTLDGDFLGCESFPGKKFVPQSGQYVVSFINDSSVTLLGRMVRFSTTLDEGEFLKSIKSVALALSCHDCRIHDSKLHDELYGGLRAAGVGVAFERFRVHGISAAAYFGALYSEPAIVISLGDDWSIYAIDKDNRVEKASAWLPVSIGCSYSRLGIEVLERVWNFIYDCGSKEDKILGKHAANTIATRTGIDLLELIQTASLVDKRIKRALTDFLFIEARRKSDARQLAEHLLDTSVADISDVVDSIIKKLNFKNCQYKLLFRGLLVEEHMGLVQRIFKNISIKHCGAIYLDYCTYSSPIVGISRLALLPDSAPQSVGSDGLRRAILPNIENDIHIPANNGFLEWTPKPLWTH